MTTTYALAIFLVLALAGYLLLALWRPEKFQ
ncbi:MAG: potassium-transporting ATPase subunit F [Thermoanaerobaculia bacterium]|nr:potassium-transporting ATPase subunit F [Thermoanaerobaculia bacterium]